MKILAIIPARGGSKGVPKKNIRILNGQPLISYSIEAASKSNYINKIVVSTDDEEIIKIASKYNVENIKRPKDLASDNSPTIDSIIHSLDFLEKENYTPNIVILLQPTSPLRNTYDIDNALKIFIENECDSVASVCEVEHSPYWSLKMKNKFLKPAFGNKYLKMRRQDLPKLYTPNGAVFVSNPEHLKNCKSFYGGKVLPYLMPPERSIDIDTELDFRLAEVIMQE